MTKEEYIQLISNELETISNIDYLKFLYYLIMDENEKKKED